MSTLALQPSGGMTALRYVGFAVVATLANLLTQEAALRLVPAASLTVAVGLGTGTGFAVKYILDKHLVFLDRSESRGEEARKIVVYGLFSVLTTLIFWLFEFGFHAIWGSDRAKYAGAVLGIAIGYACKYVLDRHFVFRRTHP